MAIGRIIIIGGGFAGVKCARVLRQHLRESEYDIVVFSRENHMVFHPLLAEVAAAAMNPKDMAAPLRELLKNVHCRTEDVTAIDLPNNQIVYEGSESDTKTMHYDQLVIASGNTTNLAFIPGMADHALPLKGVADALTIQDHVIGQLERAEVAETAEKRKWCLSFVIVGGGFSGVELAGELNDFVKTSSRFYSNFKKEDVSVILVHSHEQILPEVGPNLREFARERMERNGVKFILKASASICTPDGVGLKDGTFLKAGTVICTIGSRALPMIESLDLAKEKGRLVVNPDMSLPGFTNAWAIGDCAAVTNANDGKLSPTTGQFAERQGAQAAKNIVARLTGQPTKPFSHQSLGTLCSIGGKSAVAEMFNFRISGFPAWFVWRGVYLTKLPSLGQKIKVAVGWAFDLLFPPQLTSVRVDSTKRIGNAHYAAGDMVFVAGDPATDFYVVEQGEVEILNRTNGTEVVIAILGNGDFFGESSLMARAAHTHGCRARTDCEIMVMGKNVFSQISENLLPFRDALASSVKRRTLLFRNFPEAREVVKEIPLTELIEPLISPPMTPEHALLEVVQTINAKRLDYVYIVDDQHRLVGLVTRTDLMRWAEVIAAQPDERKRLDLKVKDLMVPAPMTVTDTDNTEFAIAMMREHGYKRLPVINKETQSIIGMLRIENVLERVLQQVASSREKSAESDRKQEIQLKNL